MSMVPGNFDIHLNVYVAPDPALKRLSINLLHLFHVLLPNEHI